MSEIGAVKVYGSKEILVSEWNGEFAEKWYWSNILCIDGLLFGVYVKAINEKSARSSWTASLT